MAEVAPIIAVFTGIMEFLKGFNDNDNNNRNFSDSAECENMRKQYDMEIKKIQEQSEERMKAMQDDFDRRDKEKEMQFYQINNSLQNEIKEQKNLNLALEKECEEKNKKIEKQKKKMKKIEKEYEEKINKLGQENKELQIEIRNNTESIWKHQLENIKLENDFKNLEKESKKNNDELQKKLEKQELEHQKSLRKQEMEYFELEKKNKIKSKENEEQMQKNQKEIEFMTNELKKNMKLGDEKFNQLEKEEREKEEMKKNEEEKQRKKDEKNKELSTQEFNKEIKIKLEEFIEYLKNKILQEKFFEELLKQYDTNQIIGVIEKIIETVDLNLIFNKKTKKFLDLVETLEINPDMNHLNILLLGPTGSGKSTLINTLLELKGNEKAEVGDDNNPKTMDFHPYTSNKKKYIRCIDSRGIEKDKEYSLDKFIKNSKELILKKLKKKNPDEFIHIILYCFEGDRFINEVRDSLYKLMDLYNDDTLPIILVHTRGVEGECDELFDAIKKTLIKENRKIDMINICAEKDDDFPAFGIPELYNLIISKVKESVKSACFSSVQNKVRDNFIKVNKEYKNDFKKEFEVIIEKEMKNIKLDSDLEEQKENYLKIFTNNIFEKILFDNKNKLSKNCIHFLRNYLNNFFVWTIQQSNEYMMNFISQNSLELISNLLTIQHDINSKHDNKLPCQKNTEKWKKEIDLILKQRLDNNICKKKISILQMQPKEKLNKF